MTILSSSWHKRINDNNLSNRLGNTFVDSSTCSNLNDLDTGIYNVNNYDGKITNVPFPGGSFMCVVAKQGDLYKYLLASVEGSLATKSLINGSWSSWAYYALKSDLNAKTPTCREQHMTADSQTLSSDSVTTLWDSEITIPFDCIMIGNWKVLCKSSDANASFYYMVNNAYIQGRVQWDGTVQTDNAVNIFVMNRFTKGQKLSVSVQGNCSVRGNNTSLTRYVFTFIPV